MKRPTGITILAILFIILGVLSLLWSGLVFGIGGLTSLFGSIFGADSFGSSSMWSGIFGMITAGIQIVVAIGLLKLKSWAWYLALLAIGLTVIQGVIGLFGGGLFGFVCGAIWLIIPVAILVYLLQANIRALFGIQSP